jgi:tungstate transport system substrate-binding protein
MKLKKLTLALTLFFLVCFLGFAGLAIGADTLIIASTTSTDNTGLFDYIHPDFTKKTGIRVYVIAVGTGKALEIAKNGDADVVLVHARGLEDKFIAEGYGVDRKDVMYNDFVIIGPKNDPAGIKGIKSPAEAFKKLSESNVKFVSRGDNSGTNVKELNIWSLAGTEPSGKDWYMETGRGMADTPIMMNDIENSYTICDRATFNSFTAGGKIDFPIMVEGDNMLFNPYGIIAVNPKTYPHVNYNGAMKYIQGSTRKDRWIQGRKR